MKNLLKVNVDCMVAVSAISDIGDRILLSNGEKDLLYKTQKKGAQRRTAEKSGAYNCKNQ